MNIPSWDHIHVISIANTIAFILYNINTLDITNSSQIQDFLKKWDNSKEVSKALVHFPAVKEVIRTLNNIVIIKINGIL